jgi:hypothetical protein
MFVYQIKWKWRIFVKNLTYIIYTQLNIIIPLYPRLPEIGGQTGFWYYLDVARESCNQSECVLQNMYLVGEM